MMTDRSVSFVVSGVGNFTVGALPSSPVTLIFAEFAPCGVASQPSAESVDGAGATDQRDGEGPSERGGGEKS